MLSYYPNPNCKYCEGRDVCNLHAKSPIKYCSDFRIEANSSDYKTWWKDFKEIK